MVDQEASTIADFLIDFICHYGLQLNFVETSSDTKTRLVRITSCHQIRSSFSSVLQAITFLEKRHNSCTSAFGEL